jgi:hypothetical protein
MSEDPSTSKRRAGWVKWLMGLISLFLFSVILGFLTGSPVLFEFPFHLTLGWARHLIKAVPYLATQWQALLLPCLCTILAAWMFHRFLCWCLKQNEVASKWSSLRSLSILSLVLLASAAAIAMSGITHQLAWLSSEPMTKNNRRVSQTVAVNHARQLLIALSYYEKQHGRYPDHFGQLDFEPDVLEMLLWMEPADGKTEEPFVLLTPGHPGPLDPEAPVIVSPMVSPGNLVVAGLAGGTVRSLSEASFWELFEKHHPPGTSGHIPLHRHE